MAIGADPHAIEGASVGRRTLRRVWELAHPYRAMLFGFLATIVFGGACLTLTAIFAMQGLSLQSDGWQFEKKITLFNTSDSK